MPYANPEDEARYQRAWWVAHGHRYRAAAAVRRDAHRAVLRALVDEARSVPCMDCRGRFPAVCMDFDHRPGTTKLRDIASLVGRAVSIAVIRVEIAKCDVVCANCHRLRTAARHALAVAS